MNGPHWIKQWIADLAMLNDQFRNDDGSVDFDALGREEYMFRMALITRNFSKSERALVVFEKAQASYETNVERGKKGGRPRKEDVEMRAGEIDSSRAISAQAGSHKTGNSPARRFSNKEDFMCWAIDAGLDPTCGPDGMGRVLLVGAGGVEDGHQLRLQGRLGCGSHRPLCGGCLGG